MGNDTPETLEQSDQITSEAVEQPNQTTPEISEPPNQPTPDELAYLLRGRGSWLPPQTEYSTQSGWGQGSQLSYTSWDTPPVMYGSKARRRVYQAGVRHTLTAKVLTLTSFTLIVAILAGWLGILMGVKLMSDMHYGIIGAELVILMSLFFARKITPLNFVLLYLFAAATGLSIAPMLGYLIDKGNGYLIYEALALTGGLTIGLTGYAWTTKRSFANWKPYLFMALLGLVLLGFLNLLFPFKGFLYDLYIYFGTFLYSMYLVYDVQQVKYSEDTIENAIMLTIELYLDIFNLFIMILRRISR